MILEGTWSHEVTLRFLPLEFQVSQLWPGKAIEASEREVHFSTRIRDEAINRVVLEKS